MAGRRRTYASGIRLLAVAALVGAAWQLDARSASALPCSPSNVLNTTSNQTCTYSVDPTGTPAGLVSGTIRFVGFDTSTNTATWKVLNDAFSISGVQDFGISVVGECVVTTTPPFINCIDGSGYNPGTGNQSPASVTQLTARVDYIYGTAAAALQQGNWTDELSISYASWFDPNDPNPVGTFRVDPAVTGLGDFDVQVGFVPEPTTALLLGSGLLGLLISGRRRHQRG